jgi:hypothetical protein
VSVIRRRARPLPPSEPLFDEVDWVEPDLLAPPWWRRALSIVGLAALVVVLGILLAIAIALVMVGSFFFVDYLIS